MHEFSYLCQVAIQKVNTIMFISMILWFSISFPLKLARLFVSFSRALHITELAFCLFLINYLIVWFIQISRQNLFLKIQIRGHVELVSLSSSIGSYLKDWNQ